MESLRSPEPSHGQLTLINVGIAFLFISLDVLLSTVLSLGLTRSLLTSAFRCLLQLQIMSLVLRRIFDAKSPWAVAGMAVVLSLLSAWEVVANKSKRRYSGMYVGVLASIVVGSVPISALASRWAMRQEPFWQAERYIPMLGMLLGNSISSVVLSVSHLLENFDSSRDKIEVLLSYGASRMEACRPLATSALRTALLPIVNQMSVVGLISIPGMMTGAILGGASVQQAAYLQSIILFVIASTSASSALLATTYTCSVLVDKQGRIRTERMWSAKGKAKDRAAQGRSSWRTTWERLRRRGNTSGNGARAA